MKLRDEAARLLTPSKYPVTWSSIPSLLPHRIRRKFRSTRSKLRSRVTPTSSITSLETSFDPSHTLRALRTHQWSFYDGQYLVLAFFGIFTLCVEQSLGPLTKTAVATLLMTSLIIPVTRQFFLPLLPVLTWLTFFHACQYVHQTVFPRKSLAICLASSGCWMPARAMLQAAHVLSSLHADNTIQIHKP